MLRFYQLTLEGGGNKPGKPVDFSRSRSQSDVGGGNSGLSGIQAPPPPEGEPNTPTHLGKIKKFNSNPCVLIGREQCLTEKTPTYLGKSWFVFDFSSFTLKEEARADLSLTSHYRRILI